LKSGRSCYVSFFYKKRKRKNAFQIPAWSDDRTWAKNRGETDSAFCPGTDLSRNYPADWGTGGSTNPCSMDFIGQHEGSEIETAAHIALIDELLSKNSLDAYLSITSYGQTVVYPYGSDKKSDYWNELEPITRKIAQSMSQIHRQTEYETAFSWGAAHDHEEIRGGSSEDYVHDRGVKYSFRLNMRDTGEFGYILPEEMIPISTTEALAGINALVTEITKIWF